jgi:transposase
MQKSQIKSIGIDLGKTTFPLVALGTHSQVVVRKKFSRCQLLAYTANLPSSLIGMEAGTGSHILGRALREQGHEVRLIPAQFVRRFVKSNKNDYRDAEAIAEAVERENMRFVSLKTEDQLDLQALHRVRERLVCRRTSVINQMRGFLLERGISFRKGPASLRRQLPELLEDADEKLTARMRGLLDILWQEWKHLQGQIESLNEELEKIAQGDEACRRLQPIPGVGPLVATAMVSAIGNGAAFHKGREFAAWLGLVPRQWSTGGRTKLLGISKRGNPYLRKMFIHGARAAVLRVKREGSCFRPVDERLGNPSRRQHRHRGRGQQTGEDQLGGVGERGELSPATGYFGGWLEKEAVTIPFREVCKSIGRTKTQSNGVPENLQRNSVFPRPRRLSRTGTRASSLWPRRPILH